jgi:hypothetical protein
MPPITAYSADVDLQLYEPKILSEGVADFTTYHPLAFADINRILIADWWPAAKRNWLAGTYYDPITKLTVDQMEFDPQYLGDPTQLKAASCFRVLGWYAYEQLAKYTAEEPDRYERKKDVYRGRFEEEIRLAIGAGLQYDFSKDGQISADEKAVVSAPRRTRRG